MFYGEGSCYRYTTHGFLGEIPPKACFEMSKNKGGMFPRMSNPPKICLRRAPQQGFNYFIVFLGLVARRKRNILKIYAPQGDFPKGNHCFSIQNPQIFASGGDLEGPSQISKHQGGGAAGHEQISKKNYPG